MLDSLAAAAKWSEASVWNRLFKLPRYPFENWILHTSQMRGKRIVFNLCSLV